MLHFSAILKRLNSYGFLTMPTIGMFYGILVEMYVLETERLTPRISMFGTTNSMPCLVFRRVIYWMALSHYDK